MVVAVTQPRWFLIVTIAILAAYIPEVVEAGRSFPLISKSLVALVVAGVLLRRLFRTQRVDLPTVTWPFLLLAVAMAISTLAATDRAVAAAELVDYASHVLLVLLVMVLIDRPAWLGRAMWAVASGVAFLAAIAVFQQLTHSYGTDFGGLAAVEPYGSSFRSGGPLSPVYFGQLLAVASVMALYLFIAFPQRVARVGALATCTLCLIAMSFTLSRAAVLAVVIGFAIAVILRRARGGSWVVLFCAVVAVAAVFLPGEFGDRFRALGEVASAGTNLGGDSSVRGRLGENMAAVQMWLDYPYVGVGPENYEVHYHDYSQEIGLDPRPEERQPHNLYLEVLAETGLLGAIPFLWIMGAAAVKPWRAKRNLTGQSQLLVEGAFVAMVTLLITAVTLHLAYSRNVWLTVGLALAAGRIQPDRSAGHETAGPGKSR
jgi:O-antigen ligase